MSDARRLVDKLWSYCDVLRDDGIGVIEYTEQLTYLLFLKMAHERATRKMAAEQIVPAEYSWQRLLDAQGDQLELTYTRILVGLAREPGVIGTIFRKAQNRIQDPEPVNPVGSCSGLVHWIGLVSSSGRLIQAASGRFDGTGGLRTNRCGVAV